MLHLGATCSSPQCPNSSSSVCMGGGHGQCGLPASVVRALHMTTATEHNLPNAQHSQHSFEAGGLIPPRSSSSTSRERRSTLFHHAHCRAENRIFLLTPGERHPATLRSGTTSAYGLARGFFTQHLLGDRESNDAPGPDFKIFSAQVHGRRLQDEDDVPHFTPGAADQFHGLLPPATRLPTTPALTSGCCFLPNFTLLRRPWTLCRGSSTTAASYRHTSVAQALPGRCVVAAIHPSPPSPTCGNLRHTWCFCFGVFVFKLRSFRMAKSRATASGVHRLIGARWPLKVSTPRRGLRTRLVGCDD